MGIHPKSGRIFFEYQFAFPIVPINPSNRQTIIIFILSLLFHFVNLFQRVRDVEKCQTTFRRVIAHQCSAYIIAPDQCARCYRCCLLREISKDLSRNRLVPHAFPTSAPQPSNLLDGRCSKSDSHSLRAYERYRNWSREPVSSREA